MSNPYIDPSGVHYNLLGITDRQALHQKEYQLTQSRALQLAVKPIKGEFDLAHLRAIHKHIFQDVYPWAGELRTVNYSKRNENRPGWKGVFAKTNEFEEKAKAAHDLSLSKNHLRGLNRSEFVDSITELYAQWNSLHPFPEGNGRATQTMLHQLAKEAGYELNFHKVTDERWRAAAAESMPQTNIERPSMKSVGNLGAMRSVFHRITEPVREPIQSIQRRELER